MKIISMLAFVGFALVGSAAAADYLPLQVGNEWVLQTASSTPEILQIEVLRSRSVNGRMYFLVSGYLPDERWLRKTEDGALLALDEKSGEEILVVRLAVAGSGYHTAISGCEQPAQPAASPVSYRGPYLDAAGSLAIQYAPGTCRDTGFTGEVYAPGIGLVRRSLTTFRGETLFDLVYAKVNGSAVLGKAKEIVLKSDFNHGSKAWLAGFSDYNLKMSGLHMLAELRPLPDEAGAGRFGFYLQNMNRSDDMFMSLKKQLSPEDGLEPNQAYRVFFSIRFSSNAPGGCVGAGGSPGESVYLKAGAVADEPLALLSPNGDVRLSVDKGEQSSGGEQAGVVGTIENGTSCEGSARPYVSVMREYAHAKQVRTDGRGSLWLVVGADSGYEGLTGLYFESITVRINPVDRSRSLHPKVF